ncbi:transcriptional regulator FtrA [Granulicella paludicola]|uniref:transcriptional regulator FtrA n=1 Tax=Granulicella paludicola TaxID=474951 RepID=UPI0021E09EA1|nr:transcriptional regulator FtrA [Granulicella paludicola]
MSHKTNHVVVVAYDGLCTFEFGVAVEAFGLPRPEIYGWYDFTVTSCESGPIRAIGGILVVPEYHGVAVLESADVIVIPGWRDVEETPPQELLTALRQAADRGARIVSLCSGAFVLPAAGVLDGRQATTHWKYAEKLQRLYPGIAVKPEILYTEDRGIFTSAGSAAAIDVCLHIIRRDYGVAIGNSVARRLVAHPHREGGQKQFIEGAMGEEGTQWFAELLSWVRANINEKVTVDAMARRMNMSSRSFARKFNGAVGEAPGRWLLSVRVTSAKDLLETTQLSLEEIAAECGFSDAALLRHHFTRMLGTTPSAYRRTFNAG